MSNFLQVPGNRGFGRPAPGRGIFETRTTSMPHNQNPKIDAEIVKKGHFWMETI
jgi:hypothetical protein